MGINSYFILSSISWSGELGADAVEVRGNIEVMVPDPLAATFFNLLFFFLNAIFFGISSSARTQPTWLNKIQVFF